MKLTIFSTPLLITFVTLLFLPTSFAQGVPPENLVRLIYFLPRNHAPQRDMDTKMDTLIKDVQQFYADQMERHGFGRKTFRFETDAQGSTVIHRIDGQFSSAYYHHNTFSKVVEEIQERFPIERHAHLMIIEMGSANYEGGSSCGTSTTHYEGTGGYALMSASGHCVTGDSALSLAAHELGHVFGLPHDFRDDAYIMSYGHFRRELSQCAAEWLDVHPYFNTPQNAFKHPTVVQMLPLQEVPPDTLRFRFQVTDVNGLHQVRLLASTSSIPAAVGSLELIECQSLTGNSRTVEFVTTELTGRPATEVSLQVMDVSGNFTLHAFLIQRSFLPGSKIEGPWLWMITPTGGQGGAHAAASGIDFLAQASGGTVTEQHIATHGASVGDAVGNKVWIPGSIAPTGLNNITETVNAIGLGIGDTDNHVAYGSLSLIAPRKQNTMMFVGSDDAVKVWLNGVLVHNNPIDRPAVNYQGYFPVTLKEGKNILLVAVYENWAIGVDFLGLKMTQNILF